MPMSPGAGDVTPTGLRPGYTPPSYAEPQSDLKAYITSITNSGPNSIKLFSERLRQTPYYRGKAVTTLTPALLKGINYLREGKVEEAKNLADFVEEKNPDLAELINAILASNVKYRAKAQDELLFAPSIYGQ